MRDAIAAKFPDGPRRCLGLAGDIVGVHLPAVAGANWFPSTGPTLPLRHAFLFYAAPAADPVPELVGELASAAGVLHRTTFDWTVDTETSGPGPEVVGATGYRYRPNVFHHELAVTPVALYETEPQSAEFDYHTEFDNSDPPSRPPSRLPSRRYGDPLPPADGHYRVPVVVPYALGMVDSACYPEMVADASDVRALHGWDGSERVEATVTFDPHPPSWMAAPAFRRAAVGPSSEPVGQPRRVVVVFEPTRDGTLKYVTKVRRP